MAFLRKVQDLQIVIYAVLSQHMMGYYMSLDLAHSSSCWMYEAYAAHVSFCIPLDL